MSTPQQTLVWLLLLIAFAVGCHLLLRRKPRSSARDEALRRRHREINRRHLGEAYRGEDGFTLPQVLWCIGSVVLVHLAVIVFWLFACAVMGMQEPQW